MTDRDDRQMDALLETLFSEAAEDTPVPSGDLMARIMADAQDELDQRAQQESARLEMQKPKSRHPLIEAAISAIGGWQAAAGLVTAGVAGLAIGFGAPSTVAALATGSGDYVTDSAYEEATSYAIDDLVPSFFTLAVEG